LNVASPYKREMLTKFFAVLLDQTVAMLRLFSGKIGEKTGRRGKSGSQRRRKVQEDPLIFLFRGNRQREELLLVQISKSEASRTCCFHVKKGPQTKKLL